jgi:hypothetical protein
VDRLQVPHQHHLRQVAVLVHPRRHHRHQVVRLPDHLAQVLVHLRLRLQA